MAKKRVKSTAPYDSENAKKSAGLGVTLNVGGPLMFGEGTRYRFRRIDGERWLEIIDGDGEVIMHIRRDNVISVGGPVYLFRDKEW